MWTWPAGKLLWRVYHAGGRYPVAWRDFRFYGPTHARFDPHDSPAAVKARGVLYAAEAPATCFAEVFQLTRVIDRTLDDPWLVGFDVTRDIQLHTLTGTWPTRAGASMAINSGPRPRAREWSRAIYAAYREVEGLLYCSSMRANQNAVLLYERARSSIPAAPVFHRALADRALLPRLRKAATDLGYALV